MCSCKSDEYPSIGSIHNIQRPLKQLLTNRLLYKAMKYLRFTVRKCIEHNDEYSYPFCPNIGVNYQLISHRDICKSAFDPEYGIKVTKNDKL